MVLNSLNNDFLREANEKFLIGDPIDDQEMAALIEFYTEMSAGLNFLGPEFHLIWKEVFHRLDTLEAFKRARLNG